MSYQNYKITQPVSIYDIQRALTSSNTDLGKLCTASTVNKWATFKPMPTGTITRINRNGTAPFGVRNPYRYVNPSTGDIITDISVPTKFINVISALKSAILGGYDNPFLNDLAMIVRPTGGTNSAFRMTDFVTTQSVRGSSTIRGLASVHGYKQTASLQFGYYDQQGYYHGISRSLAVNGEGKIVADSDQDISINPLEVFGNPFYDLDTRITWGRDAENSLCVLDWLDAMFSVTSLTPLRRGIVLFTNDGVETPDLVAVDTIPWASSSRNLPASTYTWHCVEFLTTANVTTSREFIELSQWNYENDSNQWMLIPGMIFKNLKFAQSDPYMVGAYFIRAEVYPYNNVFNLQMRITSVSGSGVQRVNPLYVFLSNSADPQTHTDFLNNSQGLEVTAAGEYYLYGAPNSGTPMYPSDSGHSTGRFDQVFTVGDTYYLCIWGQSSQSGSSDRVIWKQPLVATMADSLELAPIQ